MKLDNKPILEENSSINSKLGHFSVVLRHPVPVNEGTYL
jgi:hypothetical protein